MKAELPSDSLQALRAALTELRATLEAWSRELGPSGALDAGAVKGAWDELFARTLAVEQLAADVDRCRRGAERDLSLLVKDVGHLERAWASALKHLGRLHPESPAAAALQDALARCRGLGEPAPERGQELDEAWRAALSELTALVREALGVLQLPPAQPDARRLEADVARQKAQTEAEALRAALADAKAELVKAGERVRSLERLLSEESARSQSLERRLQGALSDRRSGQQEAATTADRLRVELDAASAELARTGQRIRTLETVLADEKAKSGRLEKRLSAALSDESEAESPLKDELDRAKARIAKLTAQLESAYKRGGRAA